MNLAIALIPYLEIIQDAGLLIIAGFFVIMAISAIFAAIGFSKYIKYKASTEAKDITPFNY